MQWYRRLRAAGLVPGAILLSRVPVSEAAQRKQIWVELLLENGYPLYNAPQRKPRKGRAVQSFHAQRLFEQCIAKKRLKPRRMRALPSLRRHYYRAVKAIAGTAEGITLVMPEFHGHGPDKIASPLWADVAMVPQGDLWP
jgi:hypothetical protein